MNDEELKKERAREYQRAYRNNPANVERYKLSQIKSRTNMTKEKKAEYNKRYWDKKKAGMKVLPKN